MAVLTPIVNGSLTTENSEIKDSSKKLNLENKLCTQVSSNKSLASRAQKSANSDKNVRLLMAIVGFVAMGVLMGGLGFINPVFFIFALVFLANAAYFGCRGILENLADAKKAQA